MSVQAQDYSKHQLAIMVACLVLAYAHRASFTIVGFCARYGFKDNRHTRKVVNRMVADGLLTKHKQLYQDGKYRNLYCGQLTKRLPGMQ